MCRLGIQETKIKEVVKLKKQIDKYKEVIIMSHLACSGNKKDKYNEIQRLRFEKIKRKLPGYKYSLAASGGIFLGKKFHYDLVRPGINLYGGNKNFNKKIMHVVSLRSPIIQINNLKKVKQLVILELLKQKKILLLRLYQWVMRTVLVFDYLIKVMCTIKEKNFQ